MPGTAERRESRVAVARFLTAGFLALVLVATPVVFWIRAEAERHALANARDTTQRLADNVVGPLITTELLAGSPAALDVLDQRLAPWLTTGTVSRIKVWDEHGKVVYSDVKSLIGQQFEQEDWALKLLEGGPATATLETQLEEENLYEAGSGELVEVYVRSTSATGTPVIFETYTQGESVRREQHAVLMGMIPPMILSLAVLQLAQLLPAVRLARRIQGHQAMKSALLQYAVEASDHERQRVAGELHDEVIQDLSGLAYALESEERQGPRELVTVFRNARLMLQKTVRTLRAMTTELYPPDLEKSGLRASLLQLEAPLRERGISLRMELPERLVADRGRSALIYRVVREALTNATKHSSATAADVQITQSSRLTEIIISDNGRGFDPSQQTAEGHYGLRIIKDTIEHAGGSLEIRSAPGAGTRIRVTLSNNSTAGRTKPSPVSGRPTSRD
ncbi:sensor histidine kinase [Paenarthrobacter ureafaciens]|uniref:sensor histidine kinase n=1 Tax=Paenarthrobacter ureafaciens TaxID=37931 RepID=UPI0022642C7F|nr:sensor histidine kinase [Paenarthrobacter ureafaciens]MCX8453701.1 sensor histidine kinase [Paenarthrobacter ureafaciens]MCY0973360.1 sensor histidine kinase [Paenarthrobacter ureafaciens]